MIDKLDKWHKTNQGLLVFAVLELAIAYGFFSLSVDRGNFIWYLLAIIFFVGSLQNFIKLFKKLFHGNKTAKTRRS